MIRRLGFWALCALLAVPILFWLMVSELAYRVEVLRGHPARGLIRLPGACRQAVDRADQLAGLGVDFAVDR